MTGEYPIIIEGKKSGRLHIARQGNKTVFDAVCGMRGEVTRISAYGEGKEIYLGVMQPVNNRLHLRRVFSPAEMKSFPTKISHVGLRGEEPAAPEEQEKDTLWRPDHLGLLWAEEQGERLCAIPRRLNLAMRGTELEPRSIGGTEYRVFKTGKNNL